MIEQFINKCETCGNTLPSEPLAYPCAETFPEDTDKTYLLFCSLLCKKIGIGELRVKRARRYLLRFEEELTQLYRQWDLQNIDEISEQVSVASHEPQQTLGESQSQPAKQADKKED